MKVTLTVLADPVKVVQIAPDVVPQPGPSAVENDAVLLAVVVIRLVFTPRRLGYHLACRKFELLSPYWV